MLDTFSHRINSINYKLEMLYLNVCRLLLKICSLCIVLLESSFGFQCGCYQHFVMPACNKHGIYAAESSSLSSLVTNSNTFFLPFCQHVCIKSSVPRTVHMDHMNLGVILLPLQH